MAKKQHACALDPTDKRLHDKVLSQGEERIRGLLADLVVHGAVLASVNQLASLLPQGGYAARQVEDVVDAHLLPRS